MSCQQYIRFRVTVQYLYLSNICWYLCSCPSVSWDYLLKILTKTVSIFLQRTNTITFHTQLRLVQLLHLPCALPTSHMHPQVGRCTLKAGLHILRHKHKPRVNRDVTSTSVLSFSLRLCLHCPCSHMAYACTCACACACACACIVLVNQPWALTNSESYFIVFLLVMVQFISYYHIVCLSVRLSS